MFWKEENVLGSVLNVLETSVTHIQVCKTQVCLTFKSY